MEEETTPTTTFLLVWLLVWGCFLYFVGDLMRYAGFMEP